MPERSTPSTQSAAPTDYGRARLTRSTVRYQIEWITPPTSASLDSILPRCHAIWHAALSLRWMTLSAQCRIFRQGFAERWPISAIAKPAVATSLHLCVPSRTMARHTPQPSRTLAKTVACDTAAHDIWSQIRSFSFSVRCGTLSAIPE